MNSLFKVSAGVIFVIWCGTNLWLAGYEQGYSEGEEYAWKQANQDKLLIPLSNVRHFDEIHAKRHRETLPVEVAELEEERP